MLKLIAALILSVGLLLADRRVDFGAQLERVPALIAALRAHFFPAPKIVVSQEKHFDTFCSCDVY